MKRVEVVVESSGLDALLKIIEAHATGYTVMQGVSGFGEHGRHEQNMVLVVTAVTADHLDAILSAISPSLNERAGVVLITDVSVLRAEHFIPEVRAAVSRSKQ